MHKMREVKAIFVFSRDELDAHEELLQCLLALVPLEMMRKRAETMTIFSFANSDQTGLHAWRVNHLYNYTVIFGI